MERPLGELPHSYVQIELAFILRGLAPKLGIQVRPEIRMVRTQNPDIEIELVSLLPA